MDRTAKSWKDIRSYLVIFAQRLGEFQYSVSKAIDLDTALLKVSDPVLLDAELGVEPALYFPIAALVVGTRRKNLDRKIWRASDLETAGDLGSPVVTMKTTSGMTPLNSSNITPGPVPLCQ